MFARVRGIRFPYLGNVPGHRYENTYCPACNELLIERYGSRVTKFNLTQGSRCPECGMRIPIRGKPFYQVRGRKALS
jgi:pyruvate formate lyase activating enzyme